MYRIIYFLLFGKWPVEKQEPEKPHTCEEFTRWEKLRVNVLIAAHEGKALPEEEKYEQTRYWLERQCTLCGMVEQRNLVYYADDKEYEDEDDD